MCVRVGDGGLKLHFIAQLLLVFQIFFKFSKIRRYLNPAQSAQEALHLVDNC